MPPVDPLSRWREHGEKPDYAGLLTFGGAPYTEDPAALAGVDVAVVGAPMDDLVSDRPGTRFARRALVSPGAGLRPARDPRRKLSPRPASRGGRRRVRRAACRRLRRRAGRS